MESAAPLSDVEGINAGPVTAWFQDNVEEVEPPLAFTLIAGGHSNLTFGVDDAAGHRYVLRRPPLGHVLATAHDMSREHRIISALRDTDVPVAPALGYCDDEAVNGAPFYVMAFVDGLVVRDAATAKSGLDAAGRERAGNSIADVLAAIHAVDVDAVGLGDLGRRDGYIERQLKRWHSQWEQSKMDDVASVESVYAELQARVPDQGRATIVHGDYRLDNCMLHPDGTIAAVLDWELCTLGDPMADLGLLMVYWNEASDGQSTLLAAPTAVDGFPTRAEMLKRYEANSDRDLSNIDFYIAFGYWKLACIIQGVYARYAAGAMGKDRSGFDGFAQQVVQLANQAEEALRRLS